MTAIPTLLSSLKHGELAIAEKILEKIQVDLLPEKTSNRLLVRCLEACESSGNPRTASLVLSFWEDEAVDDPRFVLPLIAKLFTLPELSDKVLKFSLPPDATPQEILRAFTTWESKPIIYFACERVVNLFGDLSSEEYKELMQESEEEGNQQAMDFFQTKYEESLPPAPAPEWVDDFGLAIPETLEDEPELPEVHSLLDSAHHPEERSHLKALLLLTSATGRKVLLGEATLEERERDLERFRQFGPACEGERMLWSEGVVQDFDDLDTSTACGWFTGSCDECGKRIQNKQCAIRQPREGGGWRGCFCSFDCLKKVDESPRVDILRFQLNTFGVQKTY